jgi:hypothetical protein
MDIFGNLMDWCLVLDKLDDLKKSETLHEHQAGIARILRYRNNWKLLETALEYITCINEPSDEMLTEVLDIMIDESVYLDARILAANALPELVMKRKDDRENNQNINKTIVIEKMESILDSPQPPLLNEAIRKSLKILKGL